MTTIFGIPTHPLVVHAVVVLIPLAVLGLITTGWRAEWRSAYSLPIALLAISGAIAAIVASSTGEGLQHMIRDAARAAGTSTKVDFGDHPEEGDTAKLIAVLFAVAATAYWAVVRWGQRLRLPRWAPTAVYAVSSAVGAGAVAAVVIAGHSGAVLVWKDVGNYVSHR